MKYLWIFFLIIPSASAEDINEVIQSTMDSINKVETYQFFLIKREMVDNKDTGYQYIQAVVQTEPLKVYLKFLKPKRVAGREALYQDGELIIRRGGTRMADLVLHLDPLSPLAMDGNRYPITHMNPKVICKQLVEKVRNEIAFDPKIVTRPAIYNKQKGIHYKLTHNKKEKGMECKTAEMIISTDYNLPIYFKAVNWADKIVEEYAFSHVVVNAELPAGTFSKDNPKYGLRRPE